jgi:hypothetical protein
MLVDQEMALILPALEGVVLVKTGEEASLNQPRARLLTLEKIIVTILYIRYAHLWILSFEYSFTL